MTKIEIQKKNVRGRITETMKMDGEEMGVCGVSRALTDTTNESGNGVFDPSPFVTFSTAYEECGFEFRPMPEPNVVEIQARVDEVRKYFSRNDYTHRWEFEIV